MALPSLAALSSSSKPADNNEGSNGPVRVKEEQPDEAEIREMAARMVEANKQKMANMPGGGGVQRAGGGGSGQTTLLGYFGRSGAAAASSKQQPGVAGAASRPGVAAVVGAASGEAAEGGSGSEQQDEDDKKKPPIDEPSQKGLFGWTTMGTTHIPYILRTPDEKYCAVRIVETSLLNKYMNYLHADIYSCTCIRSYYITDAEARLFNEINLKHCESQFGREPFTVKDLVVRLQDAREFYNFLDVCYNKLVRCGNDAKDKCGFIRINNESVVPYTVRDGNKFVPLFYFEGETDNLKLKAEKLENWNLAYLKFCCKVQGIRNELFASETCSVISLSDIKSYFPAGTLFEDYWPNKVVESQLLVTGGGAQKGGAHGVGGSSTGGCLSWIKAPPGSTPPAVATAPAVAPAAASTTIIVNKIPSSLVGVARTQMTQPLVSQPTTVAALANGGQWAGPLGGLVGGQPSYPASAVRMAQAPISMHSINHTANRTATYSRANVNQNTQPPQYYPSPHSMSQAAQMVSQPPPLVRVSGPPPSMGNTGTSYTTVAGLAGNTTSTLHLMGAAGGSGGGGGGGSMLPPPPHLQYSAAAVVQQQPHGGSTGGGGGGTKYPPPLIPVNGAAAAAVRYTSIYQPGAEVIDLSSPPQSPQTQQRVGQKASTGPPAAHENGMWKKLIPIMEHPQTQGSHLPFKIQKALVNEKMVPCINAKPYTNTEMLMTIPDLVSNFFPSIGEDKCRQVLQEVLKLNLYKGNTQQMQILREHQKCKSISDVLPLIQCRDVVTYMPQMKYMFGRMHHESAASASVTSHHQIAKRQRTS